MANNLAEEHLSVKGMPDILPEETVWWIYIEKILLNLMCQYGYQQKGYRYWKKLLYLNVQ